MKIKKMISKIMKKTPGKALKTITKLRSSLEEAEKQINETNPGIVMADNDDKKGTKKKKQKAS